MEKCLQCGETNPPSTRKPRKFCSRYCCRKYHKKVYRIKHKDRVTKRRRRYEKERWRNDSEWRTKKRRNGIAYYKRKIKMLKDNIFEKYGAVCVHCGYKDKRALQVDHINGGGNRERRKLRYIAFYKKVYEDTNNSYQILCANCNWIKRHDNIKEKPGPKP